MTTEEKIIINQDYRIVHQYYYCDCSCLKGLEESRPSCSLLNHSSIPPILVRMLVSGSVYGGPYLFTKNKSKLVTVSKLAVDLCKIHPPSLCLNYSSPWYYDLSYADSCEKTTTTLTGISHTHSLVEFRSIRFIMHPFSC